MRQDELVWLEEFRKRQQNTQYRQMQKKVDQEGIDPTLKDEFYGMEGPISFGYLSNLLILDKNYSKLETL